MVTLQNIGKCLVVSLVIGFGALSALGALIIAGVPPTVAGLAFGVVAGIAYYAFAKEFGSEKAWLWGVAGFLFGIIPLPVLVYCYESVKAEDQRSVEAPSASPQSVPAGLDRRRAHPGDDVTRAA